MAPFMLCFVWLVICSLRYADANCEQPNGFKRMECGSEKATNGVECCKSTEACVEVEDKDGVTYGECSETRSLVGQKAVLIVLVPSIGFISYILAAVYMVRQLKAKTSRVTQLCIVQICLSWPLFLTKNYHMGFYTVFLAVLTSYCCLWKGAIAWLYRAVWILQIFNVVAYFGAYEAFHVPFFGLSGSSASVMDCSSFYLDYFTLLTVEKTIAKDADPDVLHYGLCSMGWQGFAQVMWILQGLLWMIICGVCMPVLTKVNPSADTDFTDLKVAP